MHLIFYNKIKSALFLWCFPFSTLYSVYYKLLLAIVFLNLSSLKRLIFVIIVGNCRIKFHMLCKTVVWWYRDLVFIEIVEI